MYLVEFFKMAYLLALRNCGGDNSSHAHDIAECVCTYTYICVCVHTHYTHTVISDCLHVHIILFINTPFNIRSILRQSKMLFYKNFAGWKLAGDYQNCDDILKIICNCIFNPEPVLRLHYF